MILAHIIAVLFLCLAVFSVSETKKDRKKKENRNENINKINLALQ